MADVTAKGMMDGWIDGKHDPRALLDRIVRLEEAEVPLYNELAAGAPNECLRRTIEYMVRQEEEEIERLEALYNYLPPGTSRKRSGTVEKTSWQCNWLDRVKKVRDMEIRQCLMLCHLSMQVSNSGTKKMILDISLDELQEAQFWNDILIAYGDNSTAYPGPAGPGSGYPWPDYPGQCPGQGPVKQENHPPASFLLLSWTSKKRLV